MSLWQAHSLQQVDVPRIGAERIHLFSDLDVSQAPCLLGIRLLQPIENLVLVAKRGIIIGNRAGVDIAALCQLLAKFDVAAVGSANPPFA